jgi:uncharacterized protein (DUF3084 family)
MADKLNNKETISENELASIGITLCNPDLKEDAVARVNVVILDKLVTTIRKQQEELEKVKGLENHDIKFTAMNIVNQLFDEAGTFKSIKDRQNANDNATDFVEVLLRVEIKKQVGDAQAQIGRLKSENAKLTSTIRELQGEVKRQVIDRQQKQSKINHLEQNLSDSYNDIQCLQEKIAHLKRIMPKINKTCKHSSPLDDFDASECAVDSDKCFGEELCCRNDKWGLKD